METKPLLYGLIGFFMGGLLVSVAATTFDKPSDSSMKQVTSGLESKQGGEFDQAFITNMIEHHQSAVDMAKLAKTRAEHDEIKTLSTEIISAQEKEIDQMKSWQQRWGYPADVVQDSSH